MYKKQQFDQELKGILKINTNSDPQNSLNSLKIRTAQTTKRSKINLKQLKPLSRPEILRDFMSPSLFPNEEEEIEI